MKTVGLLSLVLGSVIAGGCGPAQDSNDKPQGVSGTKKASNFFPTQTACEAGAGHNYNTAAAQLCCYYTNADGDHWADVYPVLCGNAPGEITSADCEAKHETDYACGKGGACVRTGYNPATDLFDIGGCSVVDSSM